MLTGDAGLWTVAEVDGLLLLVEEDRHGALSEEARHWALTKEAEGTGRGDWKVTGAGTW